MLTTKADKVSPLLRFPEEILSNIAVLLDDPTDFKNLRLVNRGLYRVTKYAMGKRISDKITVYPRYASMKALLKVSQDEEVANFVRNITLLAEGLKEHEYGYEWAWEDLQIWGNLKFTDNDIKTINDLIVAHADDVIVNGDFIITGQYRSMLAALLKRFPNLVTITVRKLEAGEQIPGWSGAELVKKLSFYNDNLDTRMIFYGDWQYDTKHRRITQYRDEFGDLISEPDAGPQASFVDDLKAAVSTSGTAAKVSWKPVTTRF